MRMLAPVLACMAIAACAQVLGDDFEVTEPNGSASSSAVTTVAASSTGVGGASDCELGTTQGCESGQKCTLLDVQSFTVGCVAAGNKGPTELCAEDTECSVGLFCDPGTGVCESICTDPDTQSTCGFGWCINTMVMGYGLCTVGCSPVNPGMCGAPELTCAWWGFTTNNNSTFHCALPAQDGENNVEGDPCPLLQGIPILHSCAPGFVCGDDGTGSGVCRKWCSPPGQQAECAPGEMCIGAPVPLIQAGIEYGVCP
jgi:hypothetical protein